VVGYAYTQPYNNRCFYETVEGVLAFVFYLDPNVRFQGMGTKLITECNSRAAKNRWRKAVAFINFSNPDSTRFFKKQIALGKMREVCELPFAGFKNGDWHT
jgi:L-amino acid N-acyltransferase YncA